ncbi:oxidoreductase, partial [Pseudomonas aeruginosa]|nr:oxidoreductase [Pseudomonas aeruginosa]
MIEVIVGAIRLEAQDIHSFELFRADGAALPSFEPGAHIDLHLPNGLVRQYSLCGPAERPRHYRIAVLLSLIHISEPTRLQLISY